MPSPDRLRIALFTYATQPRGGVLHALALAEALTARGHDAVLHALDDGSGFIRAPRCATVHVPVERKHEAVLPFVQRRVATYVDAWPAIAAPFDIYHAHDGISGNALATLARRGIIPGYLRTVHHVDDFAAPALRALQDRAIRAASRCLVVSEKWRTYLAATYALAADTVPSGVDTNRFVPASAAERRAARRRFGARSGPLYVTIGGIEARKNTIGLLEAFARVHAARPSARLIIAGGASVLDHSAYRRAWDERRHQLGLDGPETIRIAGVLTDDEIVALLQAADAFVFPSLVEGFGLVLLEALGCGTPVIVSALAPFTEFMPAGDAAFVDPLDPGAIATAMLEALEPDVAARARSRGPELARTFSWDRSAAAHAALYRTALAPPAAGVSAHA